MPSSTDRSNALCAGLAPESTVNRVGIVIYSRLEGAGDSAVYRAMMFAHELMRAGDHVSITFDGAGSATAAELAQTGHEMHALFDQVRPCVRGVCRFCAKSYEVLEVLVAAEVPLLGDDRGHASLRAILLDGCQIVTF
jgi:hypothetical protein